VSPRVRAVVLNYNGGRHVIDCVEALRRTDWPAADFEIVVVDNASSDGSDGELRRRFPDLEIRPTGSNLGFPGNNVAMADLEGLDHVALVNNDAFVDPHWLGPLVEALDADPGLGAACPRILFASRFLDLTIVSPTFRPGTGDGRDLGVRLSGVEVADQDAWRDTQRVQGFWGLEYGAGEEAQFEWTQARAVVRVPVPADASSSLTVRLRLAAEAPKALTVDGGGGPVTAEVGPTPTWAEVDLVGDPYDVVNNVGSVLVDGGYGADRGYLQRDEGQFDEPEEVFAWCGGGVLLRRRYLEEVGLFDERFFLYYEDTDLAWRGRSRGWRYGYVPESRFRHIHAASSGEGSALFQHYVERNRLLMLTKNAPRALAAGAVARYALITASYARRDVVAPVLRGHRPNLVLLRRRSRSFLAYLALLPAMLVARYRNRRRQVVADPELVAWAVPQPVHFVASPDPDEEP
jgi:GT2 family glycosyltransferase